jgi:DNA invertase Pin-like site-specific DNA recombinase
MDYTDAMASGSSQVSDNRTIECQNETAPEIYDSLSRKSGRLIGYARVSTSEQHIDAQRNKLTAAGCSQIFADDGVSGTVTNRPQFRRALKALQPGDTLVVWKLDRLGRSLSHLITTITELGSRGVAFRSLTEGFDTGNAGGRLMMHVLGALAQFERELIIERTNSGLAAARRRGVKLGRKPMLDHDKLQHARQLLEAGESGRHVARTLGVSHTTLYASLGR